MKPRPSILILILTNLFPIFGVAFLNWNLSQILFLYWSENIVIGFYNILKMIKAPYTFKKGAVVTALGSRNLNKAKRHLVMFFIIHYGGFIFVHGFFLFLIFIKDLNINSSLILAIGLLFVSHGISYLTNFIGNREYEKVSPETLMAAPYKRVTVMHFTIILGGAIILKINDQSIGPLVIMTVVKTVTDFFSHIFEHNKFKTTRNNSEK